MKGASAVVLCCLALTGTAESAACRGQQRFDIMMCESHLCTECTLEYCTTECQKIQLDFPDCRCENWAAERVSYSGGDFEGKGVYGDVGDYSRKAVES
mmetsp:Transcript_31111/g.68192  ORF Transcript_31111/g.68192 Transcript_31111/m.68192 type:complete len:98 (-) Transcript_31111:95-388(-)